MIRDIRGWIHHINPYKDNILENLWKKIIIFVLACFCLSLATDVFGNEEKPILQSNNLCNDRIRNVIAVDNSPVQRFFVATFGLDNYVPNATAPPQGKKATLYSFKMDNGVPTWRIYDLSKIEMDSEYIHYNNEDSWSIVGYNLP